MEIRGGDETRESLRRNENTEEGDNHSASFDVTLNIVDVVSSIDEQSRPDLDSLGGSSSFPEMMVANSPDNYHYQLQQPQQRLDQHHHLSNKEQQTYPYFRPRDEESQENTTGSRQRSSTTTSGGTPPLQQTTSSTNIHLAPPPAKESAKSRAAIIIRHFRLVILSNIFFVIGSALFLWASLEEYQALTKNSPAQSELPDDLTGESMTPTAAPVPDGYRLQLSTSIDTYVTQPMLLMIGATFCFLQVGIINFVRIPLDKFHFFQILAGIFGLVSAMFWETKDILSTLAYFFFVHAMLGQSLLQLHSHYWKMLAPSWEARSNKNKNKKIEETTASSPQKLAAVRPFQGPVANDSPTNQLDPTLLHVGNDEFSFSVEDGFSLEGSPYPSPSSDAGLSYPGDITDYVPTTMGTSKEEQIMIQQGIQMTAHDGDHKFDGRCADDNDDDVTFQYGIVFCVADGFFVFGSTVELILTYWDLFLLTNSNNTNDDDSSDNSSVGHTTTGLDPSVHLVPGIFWTIFAIITLVATILLRRYQFLQ